MSYAIRQRQRPDAWPLLTAELITAILRNNDLPSPAEQVDLLVALVAQRQGEPGQRAEININEDRARIGAESGEGVFWAMTALVQSGLVTDDAVLGPVQQLMLTLQGWQRERELRAGRVSSRRAFMAMKYGDEELERLYQETLKPAVHEVGFDLTRLDENPPAGLIDVRLRAELRRSRFVIADLTHANPGAYWEAGFMEGLGRPVIYLCRQDIFEANRTHFDTNHSHHILWSLAEMAGCKRELAATIRATLPAEALGEDG